MHTRIRSLSCYYAWGLANTVNNLAECLLVQMVLAFEDRTSGIGMVENWWQPLIPLVNFVLLGYCVKTCVGLDTTSTSLLRRVTFNLLLPVYVLRSMWMSRIDPGMYEIALTSFVIHVGQAIFWWLVYRNVENLCMRGWLMMISQGCLTSFFYANLIMHPVFGQRAVAICLLWDIGGNTFCVQGLLWAIGVYFRPLPYGDIFRAQSIAATDIFNPLIKPVGGELTEYSLSMGRPLSPDGFSMHCSERRVLLESAESQQILTTACDGRTWKAVLSSIVYQPILPAFAIGLLLNQSNTGCPSSLDSWMDLIGLGFKPCLYFLIGVYCDVTTDIEHVRIVTAVLVLRYLFAGFIAVVMWLFLPFSSLERTTMALSFLSPVTTITMYLMAENNYPSQYLCMSATITIVSVFLSFFLQELVMQLY